jgi:hypothetical protein
VLFTNTSVTSILQVSLNSDTLISKDVTIQEATIKFNIAYLASSARISVILSDEDGTQAGNATVTVTSIGVVTVSLKQVLTSLIAEYQKSFTIRAIRGSILKASLGIETPNVAVNIEEQVTSTLEVAPTPTSTSTSVTQELGTGLSAGAIAGIVVGAVAGVVVVIGLIGVVVIIVAVIIRIRNKKKIRIEEQNNFNSFF